MTVLSVTVPFFGLVLLGYLAGRLRLLPTSAVPGLSIFVLYFALTALLFEFGSQIPVGQLLDPVIIGLWLAVALGVMALALVPAVRGGMGWLDGSFGGLIATLPNTGFMGVPILTAMLGPEAAAPIITSLLVDIVLIQSIGVALSHRGSGEDGLLREVGSALRRMAKNPQPWAIVLGAVWGAFDLPLLGPVADMISMLAAAATPTALFTIGAMLARVQVVRATQEVRRRSPTAAVLWLTALKLVAHPALVWLLGTALIAGGLPLSKEVLVVLVLGASLPSAANVSVLAERFGADSGRVAEVILTTTTLSFLTFTGLAGALV